MIRFDIYTKLIRLTERNAAMRAKNVLHQDFSSSTNDGILRHV